MSKYSEYRCEAKIVELLERAELTLAALKLVHACYFLVDQDPSFNLATMSVHKKVCFTVLCADLVLATGSAGSNDNRMITQGIKDAEGKGIFERVQLSQDRRKLQFRFSHRFLQATMRTKCSEFAMIDTEVISQLRSAYQVLFYTQACKVQRANFPTFSLPLSGSRPWPKTKRSWSRAAAKLGAILHQDYLFIPKLDRDQETVARVAVKISGGSKLWPAGNLYPRYTSEPVTVVVQGAYRSLSASELRARRHWRSAKAA